MTYDVKLYTEAELRQVVTLDHGMIDLMAETFAALSQGHVVMPPILSMAIAEHHGEVDVKTAYVPGMDGFAMKISPGFFNNPSLGLPSLNGLVVFFAAQTGLIKALFMDNGYLTDIRTAAAGGLAARLLAPQNVTTAAVIGSGIQARLQAQAAHLVRPFTTLLVAGRNPDHAETCADDLRQHFGDAVEVKTCDAETATRESQLLITTTPSTQPLIKAEWLHPNLHITAMGSDQGEKNEIDPAAIIAADLYACDRFSQVETLGEWRSVIASGLSPKHQPVEIGDIINGQTQGREDEDMITICDLTGTGAQDTAIGGYVFDRLAETEFGVTITI